MNEVTSAPYKKQVIVWKDNKSWLIDEDKVKDFFAQPPRDMVEVVRCKECKDNYGTEEKPYCDFTDRLLKPTDFCSRGERK